MKGVGKRNEPRRKYFSRLPYETEVTMPRTPSVTLADVKHALAELGLSPEEAGAQVLRGHLGRGSLSTLQRYLELLRAEGARERSLSGAIEGALRTLAPALRALAVGAAQGLYERALAETLRALEEREALLEEQEALLKGLQEQLEATRERLEKRERELEAALAREEELKATLAEREERIRALELQAMEREGKVRELEAVREAFSQRVHALVHELATLQAAVGRRTRSGSGVRGKRLHLPLEDEEKGYEGG